MWDVYEWAYFIEKMFANGLIRHLPLKAHVKKMVHGVGKYWLSGKEKVLSTAISKGDSERLMKQEMTPHY